MALWGDTPHAPRQGAAPLHPAGERGEEGYWGDTPHAPRRGVAPWNPEL